MTEMTHEWEPITQRMLELFESDGSGDCLLLSDSGYKSVARYEWRQGRLTHGFIDDDDRWYPASSFTSIMRNI